MSAANSRFSTLRAATCVAALLCLATPVLAQNGASYDVVSRSPNELELHFHNVPLKDVHADDAQNALAMNFQAPVNGAVFDQLAGQMPDWISLAYANYDTGVIRASRPVTFLTRQEGDGFSLRIVPRGPVPPPGPVALRGPVDAYGPPPPQYAPPPPQYGPPPGGSRYEAYGAMQSYAALQLAVHRDDPVWEKVYRRAATQSDSDASIGTEYHAYHNGDTVIASTAHVKIALGGGLSLIGSLYDTDTTTDQVREPNGGFGTNTGTNMVSGAGGISLETGRDSEISLEALEGNNITGVRLTGYTGDPDSFWLTRLTYHSPYLDTPEAVANRGLKDEAVISTGQHLGYGLWAAASGTFDNYGVHGNASVAKTAGWNANLRWSADFVGLLGSLSYDGRGEYLFGNSTFFAGAAPTPYIPLSIRNMETHAFTASLSKLIWGDTLFLDIYGGYALDRYARDGGLYGAAIRYRPSPGVDLALGMRHSIVSFMQGEVGPETSAGLTFTLGFNGPTMSGYF